MTRHVLLIVLSADVVVINNLSSYAVPFNL